MDLKSEVKNVMLSSLKKPSDIKIGIEIENIIYNDKDPVWSPIWTKHKWLCRFPPPGSS